MACETCHFYRSICEVTLKIHLIQREKIKVKVHENQQNSVSRYTAGADFLGVAPQEKNSKTECVLYVSITIDLIERKFQLKGQV